MMPLSPVNQMRRRWFQAGPALLAIDTDSAVDEPDSLNDAILLDEHAMLLHALALTLGKDHDWTPVHVPSNSNLTHSFQLTEQPSLCIGVVLSGVPGGLDENPHESLNEWVVVTEHEQVVSFHFSQIALNSEEFEKLRKSGSILLMKDTFRGRAAGHVGASLDVASTVPGSLERGAADSVQPANAVFNVSEFAVVMETDRSVSVQKEPLSYACQVSVSSDTGIDMRKLASTEQQAKSFAINRQSHVCIHFMEKGVCVDSAIGALFTIGQGLGVRVNEPLLFDESSTPDMV